MESIYDDPAYVARIEALAAELRALRSRSTDRSADRIERDQLIREATIHALGQAATTARGLAVLASLDRLLAAGHSLALVEYDGQIYVSQDGRTFAQLPQTAESSPEAGPSVTDERHFRLHKGARPV